MNIEELMECVFAIHGLVKYIPRSIIQTHIIPFAIEKPRLYCKKCGKILYFGASAIPSTWYISWTMPAQTIISCTECYRTTESGVDASRRTTPVGDRTTPNVVR